MNRKHYKLTDLWNASEAFDWKWGPTNELCQTDGCIPRRYRCQQLVIELRGNCISNVRKILHGSMMVAKVPSLA